MQEMRCKPDAGVEHCGINWINIGVFRNQVNSPSFWYTLIGKINENENQPLNLLEWGSPFSNQTHIWKKAMITLNYRTIVSEATNTTLISKRDKKCCSHTDAAWCRMMPHPIGTNNLKEPKNRRSDFQNPCQTASTSISHINLRADQTGWILPSGNLTVCYWKWPFIVSFPITGNSMVDLSSSLC